MFTQSDASGTNKVSSAVLPIPHLPWLLPLLSDRSIHIRWGGWALSTALVHGDIGEEIVVNEFQSLPGGLCAASLGVILDNNECFFIRTQVDLIYKKDLRLLFAVYQRVKSWCNLHQVDWSCRLVV